MYLYQLKYLLLYHFWISFMLELVNFISKGLCGVIWIHRTLRLEDDLSIIIIFIYMMDRNPGCFFPGSDYRTMHIVLSCVYKLLLLIFKKD